MPSTGYGFDGWRFSPAALATNGNKVANLRAGVDAWIAGASETPLWALLNIGVNDFQPQTSQASFEADLAYVIDAMHAAWPSCKIRVTRPWKRSFDATANTFAGYIDNVLATRGPDAAVGDDERVWLKGADDGATNTTDGIHYSSAGQAEKAAQAAALMAP